MKRFITHEQIEEQAHWIALKVIKDDRLGFGRPYRLHGIPRGGVVPAYAVATQLERMGKSCEHTTAIAADFFVEDLIDSGATRKRYNDRYPGKPFYALFDKQASESKDWLVFPWETADDKIETVDDNVVRLLQHIGEDPNREGLQETPARVSKAWKSWCSGYGQNPAEILKVFEDGAENYDQMISVIDIPLYSKCEHHMADIFGTVTIAYIPDKKIVGLSKLSRLADIFARRLQVQERLTAQIADALFENLKPKGVGVCIKARHMCMESRGIHKQGHHTMTTALRGVILTEASTRAEFLQLAR